MAWYIKAEIGKCPTGWELQPKDGYVETTQEVYDLFAAHGDWIWDGTTAVAPPPPPEPPAIPLDEKYAALWGAANEYQSSYISGAAIGLLTMGVMGMKPKCTTVQVWIKNIWAEYYVRKAGVPALGKYEMPNLDFSSFGSIPYTVPELMAEVGI